jgi:hypothetical protein
VGIDSLLFVIPMKNCLTLIFVMVIAIIMIGPASAELSIQAGSSGTGNVYDSGSIYVDSTPPGASAVLDGGEDQLFTPGTFKSVPPGTHNVKITKQGYQPYSTNVKVIVGETSNAIITMSQVVQPGSISVNSDPRGSGFYVDDIYQGLTNQIVGSLSSGPHVVTIKELGYLLWSETVQVKAAQMITLNAKLIPESNPPTGDLHVTSTPSSAAVYLNGNYQGVTAIDGPLDITDLPPGTYTVLVKKPGFQDYSTTITIEAGKLVQVNAPLEQSSRAPAAASAEIVSNPSGADVYINNAYMGITPLSFQNVPAGTYTVDIKMTGYNTYSTTGQVAPGQNIRVLAALSPVIVPTPTKAVANPFVFITAFAIVSLAGYQVSRRR